MKISNSIFVILFLTSAIFLTSAQAQNENGGVLAQTQRNENQDLGEQVKRAFEAYRKGDYQPVIELKKSGAAIVPYLKPYQDDEDSHIRSQVIWLLRQIAEPDSVPLLAKALIDKDKNVSTDAVRVLYEFYPPSLFEDNAEVKVNLRQSVKTGNVSTLALLLLRRFPGADTIQTLKVVANKNYKSQNLAVMGFPMVKPSIAANVTLSHLGDAGGDDALSSKIKIGEQNDLEFLLKTVGIIENKKILIELFQKTITDARIIQPVIDGKYKGKGVLARMKDLTVKVFTEKLDIEFRAKNERFRRYDNATINQYEKKIKDALTKIS
ncbi:MAG: HEAT repeat domain-containing protein [Pyrinomonadaceae bacterium]|nr:HEAT repeat domain-containing protein [Pyrinomonadaceae bacterium]